ncbi:DUF1934 domain-containing protein [Anaerobacillus sp. MEB173]|uniref:DUF1934 domain-containing protein n=1 Tax=Anaerobacillus sp. MEB173 TaxID=3383345 RepID=UPI003F8EA704
MEKTTNPISVTIDMETTINHVQGERETITMKANGKLYQKETSTIIRYEETIEEAGKVSNIIKINEEGITIVRQGSISSRQLYSPGITTDSVYQSPYGSMLISTETKKVQVDWTKERNQGTIEIAYILTLQDEQVGDYFITMKIEEVNKK